MKENRGGVQPWLDLQLYPALLLMYGMGLAAIASGDYRPLAGLLTLKVRSREGRGPETIVSGLHNRWVLPINEQKLLPGREREFTPLSNHLEKVLRGPLRAFLPDDSEYQETFDWFEYLLALVYVDLKYSAESLQPARDGEEAMAAGPIGRFGWHELQWGSHLFAETELPEGKAVPEKVARALQAGLFGGVGPIGTERFRPVKSAFDRYCKGATISWL